METVNDITKRIRFAANMPECVDRKEALDLADRLDAAYKRDMRTAMDEVARLQASLSDSAKTLDEYRAENARLKECAHGKCERMEVDAELCTDCPWAEIARLKAALKPVLECSIEKFLPGHETYAVEPFFTSATVGVEDAEGAAISDESIATALNAVREAQKIYNGGEA